MSDVNRIGFTLLSGSEGSGNGPYRVNIVFVHGLRGHPRHTWDDARAGSSDQNIATEDKRKTFWSFFKRIPIADNTSRGSAPQRVFWLEEFLVHDIPEARVWTYGYNADVIGVFQGNNKNIVSQHGQDFAVKLEREIENEDPIIFVAHSLGGIIVKDALHRSEVCQLRTRAFVFLGTPHRGCTYAEWGTIASNLAQLALQDSNKKIIKTLEVNSEVLDNIHEEFKTIVHQSGIRIHSFQEARGILGMKGLGNKVVSDFSSKLDLPRTLEVVETIDANHMEMARCRDRVDPRYRVILGVLKQFIRRPLGTAVPISSLPRQDRHVPRDPNAPKRGLSAYMFFANEQRQSIHDENPGIGFGRVGRVLGERWNALNEKQRAPYEAKAAQDKQRYEDEKAAYNASDM